MIEHVVLMVMGIVVCFISYKWYLAVKKNKELVEAAKKTVKKLKGGSVTPVEDKPETQTS